MSVDYRWANAVMDQLKGCQAENARLREEAAAMSAWIPVAERLPEMLVEVLVCYGRAHKSYLVAFYEPYPEDAGDHWVGQCGCRLESEEVTHWHPLPKPPEVK